ncbi:hypothetical protein P8625_02905 [Tenacibaculum tangerinum]|uniref:Uncharacterized protein n=1 Tax=Tenacibaculum tangerinum TaxID=3038772 RepID=A0ABY8L3X8_9FLAO|nr:hypothetical protein [Tenacibaculum tangerinum]WGH76133.1 hypothetical protein P8625_02905 [Tenacibaculum tangerinum]
MRKELLNGLTQKTHKIEDTDQTQFLVLQNVSTAAKIKTEIKREKGRDERLFNTMNVAFLNEAQIKVQSLLTSHAPKQFQLATVANDDAGTTVVVKEAVIDLAYGGELLQNQNDVIENYLTTLGKVTDSSLFIFEAGKVTPHPYVVKEQTYKSTEIDKKVDLTQTDFLIFDATALPSEIDIRVNGEKINRTAESLLIDQKDRFGVIAFDENDKPIFGTYKSVVLDVRMAQEVRLEDNADPRIDIKYYSIKTPLKNA